MAALWPQVKVIMPAVHIFAEFFLGGWVSKRCGWLGSDSVGSVGGEGSVI